MVILRLSTQQHYRTWRIQIPVATLVIILPSLINPIYVFEVFSIIRHVSSQFGFSYIILRQVHIFSHISLKGHIKIVKRMGAGFGLVVSTDKNRKKTS